MAEAVRILLVESNSQGLQALVDILSDGNFSVTTAVTAREAFSHLFRHDFDLIILSAQLPNTDGITIASRIKNRERTRATPILLLTSTDAGEALIAKAQALGNVETIAKPVTPDLLKAKVNSWAERVLMGRKPSDAAPDKGANAFPDRQSNLESPEARNRAAIEGIQDTAILWENPQGLVVASNSQVRRILGYQEQEILGMHCSEFFRPEDREEGIPESELRIAKEMGQVIDERWHLRKDGSRVWAVNLVAPLWKPSGELEGYIKILRDRTDQKIKDDLAQETEERYKQLLDSTVEGIIGFDLNGMCTFANVSGLGLLGFPGEYEVLGLDMHKIISHGLSKGASCQAAECPVMAMVREDRTAHGEAEFHKVDGSRFLVEYRIHTVRSGGTLIGGVVTFLDISERKRTEERLKALEKRFLQAQKLESVGRLAGGVAHELNNDLTAVIGHAELLLDRLENPSPIRPGIEEILDSGTKAADLVQKLLAFAGKQPLAGLQPIELKAFLKERLPRFRSVVGDKIRISIDLEPDLFLVFSEPVHLEQAIVSILANAREAMEEEGALKITARKSDLSDPADAERILLEPGNYDCLSISDNGRGIPENLQENLFDPFFSTKGMGQKAVGLGLSSAYGFIRQCGGTIYVESKPDRGTSVTVYLPAKPLSQQT